MKHLAAALLLGAMSITACASVEPQPCTAEWVDWKSDRVLGKFARQNRGLIRSLVKLTESDGSLSPFQAMRLMSQADDFQRFAETFQTTIVPELEAAMDQCGEAELLVPLFTEFLRDQGVQDEALQWVAPIVGLMSAAREGDGIFQRPDEAR